MCVYKRNLFIVSYVLYSFMSLKKIKRATVIKMLVFGKKYFFVYGFYKYTDRRHILN